MHSGLISETSIMDNLREIQNVPCGRGRKTQITNNAISASEQM